MKIDAVTNTYKQHNEDAYGYGDGFAWIIDGALPLDKTNVTPWKNDVTWVGNWWTDYLNSRLKNLDTSIHEHLESGILALNASFSKFAEIDQLSKLDRASFCIGIARAGEEVLECFVLGDVEVAVKLKDGRYKIVTDRRIENLDDEVIKMIASNKERQNNIVFNGYTADELAILRRNRMKMNSENGYSILEHEVKAVQEGIYESFPIDLVESVLLMTDGFSALYNKYDYCSLEGLFSLAEKKGVGKIIPILRGLEQEGFSTYQRLRKHDDATGVYCKI
jgi:hypothetical protein